jgi:hypothetical protein
VTKGSGHIETGMRGGRTCVEAERRIETITRTMQRKRTPQSAPAQRKNAADTLAMPRFLRNGKKPDSRKRVNH